MSPNDPKEDLKQIRKAKKKNSSTFGGANVQSCPICGTTVVGEGNLRSHVLNSEDAEHRGKMLNPSMEVVARYKIESQLRRHYTEKGKSQNEIAEEWGCGRNTIQRWLKKHGIAHEDRKGGGGNRVEYVNYSGNGSGYWGWRDSISGQSVHVHQLLAIANGEDPHLVFSNGEYQVHHESEIPWDNRPENIDFMTRRQHLLEHDRLKSVSESERLYGRWGDPEWNPQVKTVSV